MTTRLFALALGLFLLETLRPACADTYVRFNISAGGASFGYIDVDLLSSTPNTVANFLSYANSVNNQAPLYNNSIIHRVATVASDGVAVIQGGGFYNYTSPADPTDDFPPAPIPTNPDVASEVATSISNTRGTLAMALSDFSGTTTTNPNSANSQWYFNQIDNTALDGTFTVFGKIMNTSSLSVMDQIAAVPTFTDGGANDGGALTEIPLFNYNTSNNIVVGNYVTVTSITVLTSVQNFTAWQTAKFTNLQQQAPTFIAATATPFNDGVPNLLKYVFDINPSVPLTVTARANLPALGTTTISGTKYLTLTFHQHNALVGVTVNVQTSPDLQTWTTATNPTIVQTGTDSNGDPIMQVQVAESGTRQFIRLNVSQP
jgi:cyclophilin family peptidyl-prolyl cis-trans isomerase